MYLEMAIKEAPYLRDPFIERALLEYELNNFKDVKKYCLKALKIKTHQKTYINETFSWDNTIYDLLSLAYYNENNLNLAKKYVSLALKMSPHDERLKNNLEIIKKQIKNN